MKRKIGLIICWFVVFLMIVGCCFVEAKGTALDVVYYKLCSFFIWSCLLVGLLYTFDFFSLKKRCNLFKGKFPTLKIWAVMFLCMGIGITVYNSVSSDELKEQNRIEQEAKKSAKEAELKEKKEQKEQENREKEQKEKEKQIAKLQEEEKEKIEKEREQKEKEEAQEREEDAESKARYEERKQQKELDEVAQKEKDRKANARREQYAEEQRIIKEKEQKAQAEIERKEQEEKEKEEVIANRTIIEKQTFAINQTGIVKDNAHLPNPTQVSITFHHATLIKKDSGYYVILNVTYHFESYDDIASINFLDWKMNGYTGKRDGRTSLNDGLLQGCELTDVNNLNCSSEYLQYFKTGDLYSNDLFEMTVGGFTFKFNE